MKASACRWLSHPPKKTTDVPSSYHLMFLFAWPCQKTNSILKYPSSWNFPGNIMYCTTDWWFLSGKYQSLGIIILDYTQIITQTAKICQHLPAFLFSLRECGIKWIPMLQTIVITWVCLRGPNKKIKNIPIDPPNGGLPNGEERHHLKQNTGRRIIKIPSEQCSRASVPFSLVVN